MHIQCNDIKSEQFCQENDSSRSNHFQINPFYNKEQRRQVTDASHLLRRVGKEHIETRKAMLARGEEPPKDILTFMLQLEGIISYANVGT